jgi:transcriptional regulator with XRE-family HTH domain
MDELAHLSGRLIAAARTLAGMSQPELAAAANISITTLKRMEASDGPAAGLTNNVIAVRRALEAAGVEFTNGGQPGVSMKAKPASIPIEKLDASNDE